MKRAFLPLLALVLVGLGLVAWLFLDGRGASLDSSAVGLALTESSSNGLEPELMHAPRRTLANEIEPGAGEHAETSTTRSSAPRGTGHISGWVLRPAGADEEGIPGIPVQLWLAATHAPLPEHARPIAETVTQSMGSFRFGELAQGNYFVTLQREGSPRRVLYVELDEPGEWETVEFLIGNSRVDGVVSALDGDVRPMIELEPARRSRLERRWPDEQGRFAFEDLPPGKYDLRVRWRSGGSGGWREDSSRFELADGARQSYRVGNAVPTARWQGRVSVAGGEPPRADAVLRFEPAPAGNEESEEPSRRFETDAEGRLCMLSDPKLRVRSSVDSQGRFDVALPRSRFWVELEVDELSRRACLLGKQTLAGGDLALDLVCPGSRVRGRVSNLRGELASKPVSVLAVRHESPLDRAQCWVRADAQGRYVLDGVESGSWTLSVLPALKEQPRASVELKLESEARVVKRDL